MKVEQLMSQPVSRCRPTDSLAAAARLMWDHDCGALPVVAEDDRLVGMITDRDVCMAAYTRGERLADITVANAMAREVYTCGPDSSVEAAEQLMRRKRIRRLPVVRDGDHVVGVISVTDLEREAARSRESNGSSRGGMESADAAWDAAPHALPRL